MNTELVQPEIITLRERAARLRSVLRETAHTVVKPEPVVILLYASMNLRCSGDAPQSPAELAHCMQILKEYPWMREPAFRFLSGARHSDWPYLIAGWDELAAQVMREIGDTRNIGPDYYAPRTLSLMQRITAHRCAKGFCSHPVEGHRDGFGPCLFPGCKCGYFAKGGG